VNRKTGRELGFPIAASLYASFINEKQMVTINYNRNMYIIISK